VRYFISIKNAVDLLLAVAKLPPGRYMHAPASPRHMATMAGIYYPHREHVEIPRRRGDRAVEPLVASNEQIVPILGSLPDLYRVVNSHDGV
jgi:FlaA1/EpsC-like NDP-sugar epimerase